VRAWVTVWISLQVKVKDSLRDRYIYTVKSKTREDEVEYQE